MLRHFVNAKKPYADLKKKGKPFYWKLGFHVYFFLFLSFFLEKKGRTDLP